MFASLRQKVWMGKIGESRYDEHDLLSLDSSCYPTFDDAVCDAEGGTTTRNSEI